MKTTVIHHNADFDGIFCREIARKFLPEAELIGWDFGDAPLAIPSEGQIYILDLPVDRVFNWHGFDALGHPVERMIALTRIIWIDHHKSSIESHPTDIPGYRIDGVAACRLAWQWFSIAEHNAQHQTNEALQVPLPSKQQFVDREVSEPWAVRLAGEYDIWDKRDPSAEVFQFGLRSQELCDEDWKWLLCVPAGPTGLDDKAQADATVNALLAAGYVIQRYQQRNDANLVNYRSFMVEFEGLKFLALNTGSFNSLTFAAKDVPETGHDALLGFRWDGKQWSVSLYHAKHRTDLDLSEIAKRHGGGGHRGACGFVATSLPFINT